MTAYTSAHTPTLFQQVQEVREKRRTILEAVRKRRTIIYQQYHNRLKSRLAMEHQTL